MSGAAGAAGASSSPSSQPQSQTQSQSQSPQPQSQPPQSLLLSQSQPAQAHAQQQQQQADQFQQILERFPAVRPSPLVAAQPLELSSFFDVAPALAQSQASVLGPSVSTTTAGTVTTGFLLDPLASPAAPTCEIKIEDVNKMLSESSKSPMQTTFSELQPALAHLLSNAGSPSGASPQEIGILEANGVRSMQAVQLLQDAQWRQLLAQGVRPSTMNNLKTLSASAGAPLRSQQIANSFLMKFQRSGGPSSAGLQSQLASLHVAQDAPGVLITFPGTPRSTGTTGGSGSRRSSAESSPGGGAGVVSSGAAASSSSAASTSAGGGAGGSGNKRRKILSGGSPKPGSSSQGSSAAAAGSATVASMQASTTAASWLGINSGSAAVGRTAKLALLGNEVAGLKAACDSFLSAAASSVQLSIHSLPELLNQCEQVRRAIYQCYNSLAGPNAAATAAAAGSLASLAASGGFSKDSGTVPSRSASLPSGPSSSSSSSSSSAANSASASGANSAGVAASTRSSLRRPDLGSGSLVSPEVIAARGDTLHLQDPNEFPTVLAPGFARPYRGARNVTGPSVQLAGRTLTGSGSLAASGAGQASTGGCPTTTLGITPSSSLNGGGPYIPPLPGSSSSVSMSNPGAGGGPAGGAGSGGSASELITAGSLSGTGGATTTTSIWVPSDLMAVLQQQQQQHANSAGSGGVAPEHGFIPLLPSVQAEDALASSADSSSSHKTAGASSSGSSAAAGTSSASRGVSRSSAQSSSAASSAAAPTASTSSANNPASASASSSASSASSSTPGRKSQQVSCHQCKTSKTPENLLFCTTKAEKGKRKRRCRKKFCFTCLARNYEGFDSDPLDWMCPACLEVCQCIGCLRKVGSTRRKDPINLGSIRGNTGSAAPTTPATPATPAAPARGASTRTRSAAASASPPASSSASSASSSTPQGLRSTRKRRFVEDADTTSASAAATSGTHSRTPGAQPRSRQRQRRSPGVSGDDEPDTEADSPSQAVAAGSADSGDSGDSGEVEGMEDDADSAAAAEDDDEAGSDAE